MAPTNGEGWTGSFNPLILINEQEFSFQMREEKKLNASYFYLQLVEIKNIRYTWIDLHMQRLIVVKWFLFPLLFSMFSVFNLFRSWKGYRRQLRKKRAQLVRQNDCSGLHLSQCLHDRIVDFIEYATFLVFANICYFVTKSSTIDPFFAFTRAQTLLKRVVRSIKVSADFKVIVSPLEKKARHHRCAQRYIKFRWRSARPAANYPRLVFSQPDFPFFFFSKKSDQIPRIRWHSFHVKAIDRRSIFFSLQQADSFESNYY